MRTVLLLALAAASTVWLGCGGDYDDGERTGEAAFEVKVCAEGETLDGIDVSYWQGQPNWPAVAGDGIRFAVTRVNHGSFMDPEFGKNWAAIKSVGLVRSAYQYFNPGDNPVDQANVFIDKVGQLGPGDLPGVIDVESTDGQAPATVAANVATWVDLVEAGTGRKPIIYTGSYFWNDNVKTSDLNDHPLWIAHYTTGCPNIPDAWTNWKLWQSSSSGKIAGISGNVDTDVFNGGELKLQDFAANGYRASVVSVEHPDTVEAGTSAEVKIVLQNDGARTWDDKTRLGTTEPRDHASAFEHTSWDDDHRVLALESPVMNGEQVELSFRIQAPATPGDYVEHFNLVQEGVAWFSDIDPGGGPADDVIALTITVTEPTGGEGGGGGESFDPGGGGGGTTGDTTDAAGIPNSGLHGSACAYAPPTGDTDWLWLFLVSLPFARERRDRGGATSGASRSRR